MMRGVSCKAAAGKQAAVGTSKGWHARTLSDSAAEQAERNAQTYKQGEMCFPCDFMVAPAFISPDVKGYSWAGH